MTAQAHNIEQSPALSRGNKITGEGCAQRTLQAEHRSLIRFLHDDLGQNLVAIRSFASIIAERHGDCKETGELAQIIQDAAQDAYRRSYGLMQELRAQDLADTEIGMALETCLQESGIDFEVRVDADPKSLDRDARALVLRSTRCFVNLCKHQGDSRRITLVLRNAPDASADYDFELEMTRDGSLESFDRGDISLIALAARIEAVCGDYLLDMDEKKDLFKLRLRFARPRI